MKPNEARCAEGRAREKLMRVVEKLQSRESAQWHGYLQANELLLLLGNGAKVLPSEEAAARTAPKDERPRWFAVTPGPVVRALASAAVSQAARAKHKP